MLLIVAHHYAVHSGFAFENTLSLNRLIVQILSLGGKLGVDVFVLIGGYFLCMQTRFRWQSILSFMFQLSIYSTLIYVFFAVSGNTDFSVKRLIISVIPYGGWWFANTYFVLILLAPYLSRGLNSLSRKELGGCILLLTVLWSIFPTFFRVWMDFSSLGWFVYLFMVSAYIRRFPAPFFEHRKFSWIVFIFSVGGIVVSFAVLDSIGKGWDFCGMNKLPMLTASVSLFCIFRNMKPFRSRFVNSMAAAMFGVYLIHDSNLFRPFIWKTLLKCADFQESSLLLLQAFGAILLVFAVCTAVSHVYNLTIDRLLKKLIRHYEQTAEKLYSACADRMRYYCRILENRLK